LRPSSLSRHALAAGGQRGLGRGQLLLRAVAAALHGVQSRGERVHHGVEGPRLVGVVVARAQHDALRRAGPVDLAEGAPEAHQRAEHAVGQEQRVQGEGQHRQHGQRPDLRAHGGEHGLERRAHPRAALERGAASAAAKTPTERP
jgi:hypothetical protein